MRAVVQRVSSASVRSEGREVGSIGRGLVVLVGATHDDGPHDAEAMADKIAGLRIFSDAEGRMNLGAADVGGSVLVVSQFTLYGDVRKGKRPSFVRAAPPELAEPLVDAFVDRLRERGLPVETGRFRTAMEVELVNDGPVTILVETEGGKVR